MCFCVSGPGGEGGGSASCSRTDPAVGSCSYRHPAGWEDESVRQPAGLTRLLVHCYQLPAQQHQPGILHNHNLLTPNLTELQLSATCTLKIMIELENFKLHSYWTLASVFRYLFQLIFIYIASELIVMQTACKIVVKAMHMVVAHPHPLSTHWQSPLCLLLLM